MDQTPDVYALRMNRINPDKYPLPKEQATVRGATQHMSISEMREALRSPITFTH